MLSGLSSQIGTFIGKNNPETIEIEPDTVPPAAVPAAGSVLTSVRSQLPSWLGGNKIEACEDPAAAAAAAAVIVPPAATAKKAKEARQDEDDNSSATGGADSDNQQSEGETTTTGAAAGLEKVKTLGSYLFSTIKGAGMKIKETNILGEFQREHDSFLKSRSGSTSSADSLPPWIGHPQEEALKEEILSLSNDRRNFVRSPPSGVSFTWDWDDFAPVARGLLKVDPQLETMRYELVPKVITEEHFWRNYFYRVSLLKESMTGGEALPPTPRRPLNDSDLEQELNEELKSFEVVGQADDKEIDALLDLK